MNEKGENTRSIASRWRVFADKFGYYRRNPVVLYSRLGGLTKREVMAPPSDDLVERTIEIVKAWDALKETEEVKSVLSGVDRRKLLADYPIQDGSGRQVLAKFYRYSHALRAIEGWFFFTEAERNFATLAYLEENGIKVTRPVALLKESVLGFPRTAVLFIEKLPASVVDFHEYQERFKNAPAWEREKFLLDLLDNLVRLHDLGVYTEDTDKNTMVAENGGSYEFYFLDFDQSFPWRVPGPKRTAHCIRHYLKNRSFTEEEERMFIEACLERRGKAHWKKDVLKLCQLT